LGDGFLFEVVATDSAQNWGSLFTGAIPCKHKFKYEELDGPKYLNLFVIQVSGVCIMGYKYCYIFTSIKVQ
jgi:hypothetical protein